MKKLLNHFQEHPLNLAFILMLSLAVFLRVWKLETQMIFFADIGKDMLTASRAVEQRQIPLLGIESSIPRFRQGPVFIWLMMACFLISPNNPLVAGYVVVGINVIGLTLLYELLRKHVNSATAVITTLILAASPLAVAHSRMPYHIAPMIFALVLHLWAVIQLNAKKPFSIFLACLSWTLVFQFELAFFPTSLILAIKLWPILRKNKLALAPAVAGSGVGLLPQLIFDATHRFAQLGGFVAWVGYRIASFVGVVGPHTASASRLQMTINHFSLYLTRIFSIDQPIIAAIFVTAAILSCFHILKWWRTTPGLIKYVFGFFIILTAGYVVHSAPSEAYFPPFVLLLPILIGWGVSRLTRPTKFAMLAGVAVWAIFSTTQIINNNWFTQPTRSAFHYGPSYKSVVQTMLFIRDNAQRTPFTIASTDEGSQFPSYLDNYKMVAKHYGIAITDSAPLTYFINQPNSDLSAYPNAHIYQLGPTQVIKVLQSPEEIETDDQVE